MRKRAKKARTLPATGGNSDAGSGDDEDDVPASAGGSVAGKGDTSDDGGVSSNDHDGDAKEGVSAGSDGEDEEDPFEASRQWLTDSVTFLKRELGAVAKKRRKLSKRGGKRGTKADRRKRTERKRELDSRHSALLGRLQARQRELAHASVLQLQSAGSLATANATSHVHRFTKPPPRSRDEPKLYLSAKLSWRTVEEFYADYEYWMGTSHKFPETEAKDGVVHHRWSNLLPAYVDNKSKEDKRFFMSLCGDRGKPWKKVKKKLLGRFAKSDNWLEPASYLDQLSQKEGQSATSYCEAFAAAVDKTILGVQTSVGSWRTGHTHYLYKLLEHANPGLRKIVTEHEDFRRRETQTDFDKLVALVLECEASMSNELPFSHLEERGGGTGPGALRSASSFQPDPGQQREQQREQQRLGSNGAAPTTGTSSRYEQERIADEEEDWFEVGTAKCSKKRKRHAYDESSERSDHSEPSDHSGLSDHSELSALSASSESSGLRNLFEPAPVPPR
jgi:hypothetical protein